MEVRGFIKVLGNAGHWSGYGYTPSRCPDDDDFTLIRPVCREREEGATFYDAAALWAECGVFFGIAFFICRQFIGF